jgi:hypothetical protein
MVSSTPRPLYSQERDSVPILHEAGWALGPVWTGEENLAPTGILSADRSARSESLSRIIIIIIIIIIISQRIVFLLFNTKEYVEWTIELPLHLCF